MRKFNDSSNQSQQRLGLQSKIVYVQHSAGGRIIEVIVGEKLHQEDYSEFVDMIEKAIAKWGKVRLLFEFREFHGWDLAAFWEDLKFDYKHFADFDRMAIVGDAGWEKWMTILCKPITKAKLKYFDLSERDEALAWLSENLIPAS